MPPDIAIRSRGLTKHFGPVRAVNDLDLDIPRSKIFGFLGPNGSGKSTTIRMLCGLLMPTAGEISVLGHEIPRDAEQLKQKVGYMTQKFSLFEDLTVLENLRFMADIYTLPRPLRKTRIDEAVERQSGTRRFLGDVLVELGHVTTDDVASALAEQLCRPVRWFETMQRLYSGIIEVRNPRVDTYKGTPQEWFSHGEYPRRILPTICVHRWSVSKVSNHSSVGSGGQAGSTSRCMYSV